MASQEVPKKERLEIAIKEYNQALLTYENSSDPLRKKPAIEPIALYYGIVPTTLRRRVAGKSRSHQEASKSQQRLSPAEEQALKSWILQVEEWGWPPKISLVRHMAKELLIAKGDHKELGRNWINKFLDRHPELQSRFSQPLDKDRAATHDAEKLLRWFQLVQSVIQKYDIQEEDTYNMDEKGFALGDAGKMRVLCSKQNMQTYVTQDGSREWVTLIECISVDGRLLSMFLIFKGKVQMKSWFEILEEKEACIAVSENGWTNNVLGLGWFEKYVSSFT